MGLPAALLRNAMLSLAFLPRWQGNDWIVTDLMFAMGAILLSHPFETVRVLVVNGQNQGMFGNMVPTLQTLYANEGIAGLYRGFVPRALYLTPVFLLAQSQKVMPGNAQGWQAESNHD